MAGTGGWGRVRAEGEPEAWWGSWAEGVVDMGRPWRGWWRLGKRERRDWGPRGVVVAPWGAGAARVSGCGAVAVWGA